MLTLSEEAALPSKDRRQYALGVLGPDGQVGQYVVVEVDRDFMGITEIAEQLGISRQRVSQLVKHADFPEPLGRTKAGPFWLRSEVEHYAKQREATVERHLGLPRHMKAAL